MASAPAVDFANKLFLRWSTIGHWFNHERISLNKNGLTPIEYRNQSIN
ncbi:IS3 family transposase [Limosilactobacillus mucosae]